MNNNETIKPRCAGCSQTFESYGMTQEQGFAVEGKVYCNDDCFFESQSGQIEQAEWESLAIEFE